MSSTDRAPWMPTRLDLKIVGATLLITVMLLGFGVITVGLLGSVIHPDSAGGSSADPRALFGPWVRWDAPHYLDIAVFGYRAGDTGGLVGPGGYRSVDAADMPNFIVFFPLYPALVGVLNGALGDPTMAAFLVTGIASLFAGPLLYRLVAADESPAIAIRSVWFFLIFPTAYFFHIGYTEALFFSLSVASMLAARTDRWWSAGVLGALATLTRINGLILVPTLVVEAAVQWWPKRDGFRWRWLAIGLVPLGFVGYLAVNQAVYGDPVAFLAIQAAGWNKSLSPPWVGIRDLLDSGLPRAWVPELAFVGLAIVGLVFSAIRFRPTWTIWMGSNLLLFTSTSFVLSVPRYSLLLFPLFVWFAVLARARSMAVLISVISVSLLMFFAGRFALGVWAF